MAQIANFHLDKENLIELSSYLKRQNWLQANEKVEAATIPGAGNMNYTLRIHTNQRTFIIKQARPYVEKYPQIPAPTERAMIEAHYYQLTQQNPTLRAFTPQLMGKDEVNCILIMQDLGEANDYTNIYQKGQSITPEELTGLMDYLGELHQNFNTNKVELSIQNRAMRALNAEHIFNYPLLEENGFDLNTVVPGLQPIAMKYKQDAKLKAKAVTLSKFYTNDGTNLLHGDYYPGSWLKTDDGVKVIDPEFCFFGPPEFDLSVTIAHLKMAQHEEILITHLLNTYHRCDSLDQNLLNKFIGIEIIRRIIGLAQLPLGLSLEERGELLEEAYDLLMAE